MAAAGSLLVTASPLTPGTGLILFPQPGSLPAVWAGPVPAGGLEPGEVAALLAAVRPCPLLPEHGAGWFGRPGLSGHRLDTSGGHPAAGRDWSPLFRAAPPEHGERRARVEAEDSGAGLRLVTEAEAVPGGAIRVRHTVANTSPSRMWWMAWRSSSRCPGGWARCWTSPGGRPPSGSRSATGWVTGCGCVRAAGAHRA